MSALVAFVIVSVRDRTHGDRSVTMDLQGRDLFDALYTLRSSLRGLRSIIAYDDAWFAADAPIVDREERRRMAWTWRPRGVK